MSWGSGFAVVQPAQNLMTGVVANAASPPIDAIFTSAAVFRAADRRFPVCARLESGSATTDFFPGADTPEMLSPK